MLFTRKQGLAHTLILDENESLQHRLSNDFSVPGSGPGPAFRQCF